MEHFDSISIAIPVLMDRFLPKPGTWIAEEVSWKWKQRNVQHILKIFQPKYYIVFLMLVNIYELGQQKLVGRLYLLVMLRVKF